jgi:hypothetical protein
MTKFRTPYEEYVEEQIKVTKATAKMDKDLSKFGKPTGGSSKGMVWTVGDMQRYFESVKKKK